MKIRNLLLFTAFFVAVSCGGGSDRNSALQEMKLIPVRQNSYYSYVNLKGEQAFEGSFLQADWFSDGLALVEKRDVKGNGKAYINENGETVIDASGYSEMTGFWEGVAWVKDRASSLSVAIDTKGKELFRVSGKPQTFFCNGTAWIRKDQYRDDYMLVDKTGKMVAEFGPETLPSGVYLQILPVLADRICVRKGDNDRFGAMNLKGKLVVDYLYMDVLFFDEGGLAVARNEEGQYGVINKNGKEVISFEYDEMEKDGDLFRVCVEEKYGWCNRKGKMVITPTSDVGSDNYFAWNDRTYTEAGQIIGRKGMTVGTTIQHGYSVSVSPVIGNQVVIVSRQLLVDMEDNILLQGFMNAFKSDYHTFHMGLPYVYWGIHVR